MNETLSDIDKEFYRYCCLDSCVTYEINTFLEPRIKGTAREQYKFNIINMLLPLRYMEIRGIRYDKDSAKARRNLLRQKMHETQAHFNALTGYGFTWTSVKDIITRAEEVCLTKDGSRSRKSHIETWERIQELLTSHTPTSATIGELEDLCEVSLNEGSKTIITYLYDELKLPAQWSEKNKQTGETHRTANYEACLNLSKYCQKNNLKREYEIIQTIITLRALDTRQRMLSISADRDGRIRCGYNIVGSETGRITCYTSPTGSGYNLQTIPKYTNPDEAPGGITGDRDLFLADSEYYIFECDLEGADSWTVAAYCAMLGDRTMLEDLQVGIRPAKRITLKLRGIEIDYHNIEAVLEASKSVSKSSWDYFACKRVVHGGSYLEGAITIGRNILKDSEGKMFMDERECNALKDLLLKECYPGIKRYHQYIGRRLAEKPYLIAASGQIRQFFGRPDEILTKAVAFEPQANTTYATNKAMVRLWTDRDNRKDSNKTFLRVEPLHQVHDALIGQFRQSDTTWAVGKIKQWFANPITIAGITLTIPFEGSYGTSWGNLKAGTIQ